MYVQFGRYVNIRCVFVILSIFFTLKAQAINRNNIFSEIEKLNSNWSSVTIEMWVNEFEGNPDPGVTVGDKITYQVKTNKPAFFTFILVDAKGGTSVLKPDALATSGIATSSTRLTFPALDDGKAGENVVVQSEPLGKETVYLLVSEKHLHANIFNMTRESDYVEFGPDIGVVADLITRLNKISDSNALALYKYEYFVASDTQFTPRGIRREVTKRVKEVEDGSTVSDSALRESSPLVINDIKFEFDSAVLTDTGIDQMEILGSELIDRQANKQLPKILLTGHTDSDGSAEYNYNLTINRAISAKRFLIDEFGLPEYNILTDGQGESVPIESNSTVGGKANNRRVEFKVVR